MTVNDRGTPEMNYDSEDFVGEEGEEGSWAQNEIPVPSCLKMKVFRCNWLEERAS